ncbi:DNA-binding protein [Ursidibacter sp. B-7004-1]
MKTGFYIVGIMKGYKNEPFTNRETGEIKDRHSIGIQLQSPDGYGGYDTSTQDIKVDPQYANDALKRSVAQFKDKLVIVSVTPREWAMEGGRKGITYNFDSHSTIELAG